MQVSTRRSWCLWTRGQWCWQCWCWIYIIVTSVVQSLGGFALWRLKDSLVCCVCTHNNTCLSISIAFSNDESLRRWPRACSPVTRRTSALGPVYTRYKDDYCCYLLTLYDWMLSYVICRLHGLYQHRTVCHEMFLKSMNGKNNSICLNLQYYCDTGRSWIYTMSQKNVSTYLLLFVCQI